MPAESKDKKYIELQTKKR